MTTVIDIEDTMPYTPPADPVKEVRKELHRTANELTRHADSLRRNREYADASDSAAIAQVLRDVAAIYNKDPLTALDEELTRLRRRADEVETILYDLCAFEDELEGR